MTHLEKYYTPELEEFHVGFEYENKVIDLDGKTIKWLPVQWTASCNMFGLFNVDFNGDKHLITVPDSVRVKYLDREDIESLGWKHSLIQNYKYTDSFFKDSNPKYAQWSLELNDTMSMQKDGKYVSDENEINSVCIKFFHPDDSSGQTIFYGTIKNKSELKKVLKMLGI